MISILFMVICHVVIFCSLESENWGYIFADVFLGGYLGAAPGFMICMGIGITYSRKSDPKSLLLRGIKLLLLGYLLSFVRHGISALVYCPELFWVYTLTADILPFAGVSFMVLALFRKLKLKSYVVLIIAVVLSSTAFLFYGLDTGNISLDNFFTLFIPNEEIYEGFSFVSWFIYVIYGMFLGNTIQRIEKTDRFYLIMMIVSFVVAVPGVIITFNLIVSGLRYYGMIFPTALVFIACSSFLLSLFYFICKKLPEKVLVFNRSVSSNITYIYVIHWLVVGPISMFVTYDSGEGFPIWILYIAGVLLFVISWLISIFINRLKRKTVKANS